MNTSPKDIVNLIYKKENQLRYQDVINELNYNFKIHRKKYKKNKIIENIDKESFLNLFKISEFHLLNDNLVDCVFCKKSITSTIYGNGRQIISNGKFLNKRIFNFNEIIICDNCFYGKCYGDGYLNKYSCDLGIINNNNHHSCRRLFNKVLF